MVSSHFHIYHFDWRIVVSMYSRTISRPKVLVSEGPSLQQGRRICWDVLPNMKRTRSMMSTIEWMVELSTMIDLHWMKRWISKKHSKTLYSAQIHLLLQLRLRTCLIVCVVVCGGDYWFEGVEIWRLWRNLSCTDWFSCVWDVRICLMNSALKSTINMCGKQKVFNE